MVDLTSFLFLNTTTRAVRKKQAAKLGASQAKNKLKFMVNSIEQGEGCDPAS